MRRYIAAHLPVALIYSLLIVGLNVLRNMSFGVGELVRWGWFVVGVVVGVLILILDRLVYTYSYPSEQLSQHFVYLWKQKKWMQAMALLDSRRSEQQKLTFRSALFISVWVFLAFFAITSTYQMFGKGVVMGLMLHVLYDAWRLQKMDEGRLNTRLFWQIKRSVSHEEQLVFLWVVTGIFVLFSFWVG